MTKKIVYFIVLILLLSCSSVGAYPWDKFKYQYINGVRTLVAIPETLPIKAGGFTATSDPPAIAYLPAANAGKGR